MDQTGHISPVFVDSTGRRRRRLRRVAFLFGTVSLVYTGLVSASFSSGPGSPFGLLPLPDLLDRPDRAPSTAPRERAVAAPAEERPVGVWVESSVAPKSTDPGGAPASPQPAGPGGAVSTPGPPAAVGEHGSADSPMVQAPPGHAPMAESTHGPQAGASPQPDGHPAPAPDTASPQPTGSPDPSPQPDGNPAPASTPAEPSAGASGTPESSSTDTRRAGRPSPRPAGKAAAHAS